jgi:dihydrodipicolinate synthase/N-acetylneuraminate lyase
MISEVPSITANMNDLLRMIDTAIDMTQEDARPLYEDFIRGANQLLASITETLDTNGFLYSLLEREEMDAGEFDTVMAMKYESRRLDELRTYACKMTNTLSANTVTGDIPPLATPHHADGTLNEKGLRKEISASKNAGVDGVFVYGTAGGLLNGNTTPERVTQAVRISKEVLKKKPVCYGASPVVGTITVKNIKDIMEQVKSAKSEEQKQYLKKRAKDAFVSDAAHAAGEYVIKGALAGGDVSVVPQPFYGLPEELETFRNSLTDEEIIDLYGDFYRTLLRFTEGEGVMIDIAFYDIDWVSGGPRYRIPLTVVDNLTQGEGREKRIRYMKDSTKDSSRFAKLSQRQHPGFGLLQGVVAQSVGTLAGGRVGDEWMFPIVGRVDVMWNNLPGNCKELEHAIIIALAASTREAQETKRANVAALQRKRQEIDVELYGEGYCKMGTVLEATMVEYGYGEATQDIPESISKTVKNASTQYSRYLAP